MNKKMIAISSLFAITCGFLYLRSDGLVISVDNGVKTFSNSLQSSGGDDGYLLSLGFLSFTFSFLIALASMHEKVTEMKLQIVYLLNLMFLAFIIFLVDLDVSVAKSIALGDYLLLAGLVVVMVPIVSLVKRAIQQIAKR